MKSKFLFVKNALQVARKMMFPDPVTVRLSPADFHVVEIHGIEIDRKGERIAVLTYVDEGMPVENWEELTLEDANAERIVEGLYERLVKMLGPLVEDFEHLTETEDPFDRVSQQVKLMQKLKKGVAA
jgi:hypothetical protein